MTNLRVDSKESKSVFQSGFQSANQPGQSSPHHQALQVVTIYPEEAKSLLASTEEKIQRKIKRTQVTFLKNQILQGKWVLDGNTIKIDKYGNVIDGRHRLTACVEANTPITTYFIKGLETNIIRVLDRGIATRTLTDVMAINLGITHKYENQVVSVANFCHSFAFGRYGIAGGSGGASGSNRAFSLDSSDFLNWISSNEDVFSFVANAMTLRANGDKLFDAKIFCGLYWILSKRDTGFGLKFQDSKFPHLVDKYFAGINDGVGFTKDSIIWQIRNRMMTHLGRGGDKIRSGLTPGQVIWVVLKGWECYCEGKTLQKWHVPKRVTELPIIY